MVASGTRKALAISSVVRPQIIATQRHASFARHQRWQAVKIAEAAHHRLSSFKRCVQIGHGLLFRLELASDHLVLAASIRARRR